MPSPVTEVRAGAVRPRYLQHRVGAELPVPDELKSLERLIDTDRTAACERRLLRFALLDKAPRP